MMIPERPALERRVLEALDVNATGNGPAGGRIPVVLGGCGTGRSSLLLRLRDLLGRNAAQHVDVERIATTPERFSRRSANRRRSPARVSGGRGRRPRPARVVHRGAGISQPGAGHDRRPGHVPARRVPRAAHVRELPGLALGAPRSDQALGASQNRFVLTTRYTARAHRLLRDAPARFEILPVTPLSAAEVRATLPAGIDGRPDDEDHAKDDLARLVHALSDGRPSYARMIAEGHGSARAALPIRSARSAPCSRRAPLAAACRYSYELRPSRPRLRRAQGHPRSPGRPGAADADRDRPGGSAARRDRPRTTCRGSRTSI